MMFTYSSDKKSTTNNWFSSLRRQPKNSSNAKDPKDAKKIQKSCIDLTAHQKNESASPQSTDFQQVTRSVTESRDVIVDRRANGRGERTEERKVVKVTTRTVIKQRVDFNNWSRDRRGLVFDDNGRVLNLARRLIDNDENLQYIDDADGKGNSKQIKDELCEVVSEMESLDSQEDCKYSNKDKQMSIGRKKFNMDPKKGIEYLRENHLIRMDPQDVAYLLYKGEGLNKTAIGDYLGEKNDFNEQVLKAFVELHDFTNLILVQALRQFLWSFRLPGEAQKIDRMMECFAQRYCHLNPDIFTNTDTCYVLSFAIIMLNTSLHNPSVKDKPSIEQFISMNRGINNGGDLPRELLESLYESIKTEPFKIPQDDGNDLMHTFFNPDKEGWLWKQGGRYKSWKRRWFILNDNCLYYFEYTADKEPRGIIPLENISVREISDRNKPHCFELYACGGADIIKACKTDSEGKVSIILLINFIFSLFHALGD
uniref:Cytohesin-1 n=1 Tax=Phlebotomus papatasi TaxID=29031 RepID=A0A1B0FYA9_PHLPP